ncbi:LOW QUALITY PROTEIN: uncharacterized protein [Amphiura filiformis]|uniref:LOW QUALITY PROTEIN: uncharacterized protein n=1 Tax=Amphiura filiformis TaxID=82378 RepID=UPI003B20EA86
MSLNFCRVALRSINGGYNAALTPVVFAVPNRPRIRQCQHQQRRTKFSLMFPIIPTQIKINRMLERCNERSKIIVVDGNIASGKSTVAKQIADSLGMLHMPEADVQYVPKRRLGHPVEDKYVGDVSLEKFYADPFSKDYHAFNFQYMMYVSRYFQMCDAIKHVMHTAQGVVLERSVFSDFVFMEAEHKIGCFARDRVKLYDELVRYSLHKLVAPHVVVYLDVPVDKSLEGIKERHSEYQIELVCYTLHKLVAPHVVVYLDVPVDKSLEGIKKRGIRQIIGGYQEERHNEYQIELVCYTLHKLVAQHVVVYLDVPVDKSLEGIKKRGIAMEQNITKPYLQHLEDAYKEKYLPKAAGESIVLEYDWTNPLNNVDRILEDFELTSEEDWKHIKWNQLSDEQIVHLYHFIMQDHKIFLRMQIDSSVPGWEFKPEEHDILREEMQQKYFPRPKNYKEVLAEMFSYK